MTVETSYSEDRSEFERLLRSHPDLQQLAAPKITQLGAFYEKVRIENEIQNLTRLLSPRDFFDAHVLDAWELEKSGCLTAPAFDLGSGVGSPGLIHAIITEMPWILCDSEAQKASFLARVASELGISCVTTTSSRAEAYLSSHKVGVVVVKAVGSVEKIYGWLSSCSTWNKMVLLKGPKWDDEWKDFTRSKYRSKLEIISSKDYTVGADSKQRKIICLKRT